MFGSVYHTRAAERWREIRRTEGTTYTPMIRISVSGALGRTAEAWLGIHLQSAQTRRIFGAERVYIQNISIIDTAGWPEIQKKKGKLLTVTGIREYAFGDRSLAFVAGREINEDDGGRARAACGMVRDGRSVAEEKRITEKEKARTIQSAVRGAVPNGRGADGDTPGQHRPRAGQYCPWYGSGHVYAYLS